MHVGAELRQAREQRGLSLQQLAELTKIRVAVLHAIESNTTTGLPGGLYVRSFVATYAREVGLDPTTTARRFLEQFNEPIAPQHPPSQLPPADSSANWLVERVHGLGPAAAGVLVIVCVLTLLSTWNATRVLRNVETSRANELASPPEPSTTQQPAGVAVQPVVATTSDTTSASVSTAGTGLRIELVSRAVCWVAATADGERVVYRLMQAGERQTIEATRELVLRVGEPTNLDVSINGLTTRPLGVAGEPATVRITPQNFQDFVNR